MKIFKFEHDETDWVFAESKWAAKAYYLKFTECGTLEGVKVTEIPEEEWPHLKIIDPDSYCEEDEIPKSEAHLYDDYGYKIIQTFEEYAAENQRPELFCTTAF